MEFEVVNVVGIITYQQRLDLSALEEDFLNREEINDVTYKPEEDHWLQTRFRPDDIYISFYQSGRCSIIGCGSIEHFESKVNQVNDVMEDLLGFDYTPEAEIKNIVVTASVTPPISLELLNIELGLENTEYEPEQFPGLIYRSPDYVVLVFSTGKLLFTGITDHDAIPTTVDEFTSRIQDSKM